MTEGQVVRDPDPSLVTTLHVTYALHALGLAIGAFGASTIIGSFIFGWPSIIAVIINYVKRSEVRGTWLDSHFSWQIRTFWFALLWLAIGGILFATVLLIPFAFLLWFATGKDDFLLDTTKSTVALLKKREAITLKRPPRTKMAPPPSGSLRPFELPSTNVRFCTVSCGA